jgi:hypothetical protein
VVQKTCLVWIAWNSTPNRGFGHGIPQMHPASARSTPRPTLAFPKPSGPPAAGFSRALMQSRIGTAAPVDAFSIHALDSLRHCSVPVLGVGDIAENDGQFTRMITDSIHALEREINLR